MLPAFGIGTDDPREYEAAGVLQEERAGRTDEAVSLLRRLWSEDHVTHQGRYYRTTDVTITGGLGTDTVEFTGDYLVPSSSLTVNAEHIKVDSGITINVGTGASHDINFNAIYKDNGISLLGITTTTPVRTALLASGRFLTMVHESVLTFPVENPAFKRLPIQLPTTRRPVGIITLKNRTLTPVAQLFIDCAREVAKVHLGCPRFSHAYSIPSPGPTCTTA